mgnify:CR=1 FL=1
MKKEGKFAYQILSNWSLKFLSSPILRPWLPEVALLSPSLLLDSWRDLWFI